MSFKDVKILCKCFEFDHGLPFSERSIFNTAATKWPVGPTVDLMDYAIDIGKLSYSAIRTELEAGYNSLVYDCGDMTIKLSGIKNNKFLVNYFDLYNTNHANTFKQYIIQIKYNNQITFIGTLNQDNISELNNSSKTSEIITIQLLGLEKEFKRYFGALPLPDHKSIFINGFLLPWGFKSDTEDKEFACCLNVSQFFSSLFQINALGPPWFVNNIPQMYVTTQFPDQQWYIKSGYKRFYQDNKYSCFDLLDKTCDAMGWRWQVNHLGESFENFQLMIRNNSDYGLPVLQIDYGALDNYKIGYQINRCDIDYIIIPDGYYKTGTYFGKQGKPFYMMTNKFSPINETRFFEGFHHGTGNQGFYTFWPWNNQKRYCVENAEAKDTLDYGEIYYWDPGNWSHNTNDRKFIKSNKILFLDGGSHDSQSTVCAASTGRNYNAIDVGQDPADILFRGCCGSILFQYDPGQYWNIQNDYNNYCKSSTFTRNFLPLLEGGNNQTIESDLKGVITDPLVTIRFINSNNSFFQNSLFALNQLEVDYINESSKILLTRQN